MSKLLIIATRVLFLYFYDHGIVRDACHTIQIRPHAVHCEHAAVIGDHGDSIPLCARELAVDHPPLEGLAPAGKAQRVAGQPGADAERGCIHIRTAEGEVFLDVTGKKNGRGAYICKDAGCLEKARKKKALDRSLKIEISDEVYESLKGELDKIDK